MASEIRDEEQWLFGPVMPFATSMPRAGAGEMAIPRSFGQAALALRLLATGETRKRKTKLLTGFANDDRAGLALRGAIEVDERVARRLSELRDGIDGT